MANKEIDWANLDKEKAAFILEQAREYLEKTLYASDQLDNKAFILLGFSVTFMTGTIGYILSQSKDIGWLIFPLSFYVFSLIVACLLLKNAIKPKAYHGTGNLPEVFLQDQVLSQSTEKIIIGEAKNYGIRYRENEQQNKGKKDNIDFALFILLLSPLVLAIGSIVLYFLYLIFC